MKIAILGYGVEGKSIEAYFKNDDITIFDDFDPNSISEKLTGFDLIFRSPSVPPKPNYTSATRYFFKHCPAPIIGVTGTKGKGTTCTITAAILSALGYKVHLIGNIGTPALSKLDKIKSDDVVIYELSSFQLWDLDKSPHVAGVLRIEPDHLDIHKDFEDYVSAKANITKYQSENDYCVYYANNSDSKKIAEFSSGTKLSYPLIIPQDIEKVKELTRHLPLPGDHNQENATAAILIVAAYLGLSLPEFITQYHTEIVRALENFKGLPHRLSFVRELNGVKYYDDNYSSAFPALDVAIKSFKDQPIILITGGKDRGLDLTATKRAIFDTKNIKKAILIGETKQVLSKSENPTKYLLVETLKEAVSCAQEIAENYETESPVVLMSPGAASFDMFENFKDRGEQFIKLVKGLK